MQDDTATRDLVELDVGQPIWDRFFWVAPLVIIGTREPDGGHDLAPKHMVTPLGWKNYFGFVCTPRHRTFGNAQRVGAFTVTYPRPDQLVATSLAASPRQGTEKPALSVLPVFPASTVPILPMERLRSAYYLRIESDEGAEAAIASLESLGVALAAREKRDWGGVRLLTEPTTEKSVAAALVGAGDSRRFSARVADV